MRPDVFSSLVFLDDAKLVFSIATCRARYSIYYRYSMFPRNTHGKMVQYRKQHPRGVGFLGILHTRPVTTVEELTMLNLVRAKMVNFVLL